MPDMTPADRARQILTDATTLATLHDTARANMQLGQPGLPEQTPGAGPASSNPRQCHSSDCEHLRPPCPLVVPDGGVTLTATERLGTTRDQATRDLDDLNEHCRQAAHHLAKAATLAIRWQVGVTDADVKTSLQERLDEIWCKNCAKAGISTVRRPGRPECAFCEAWRLQGACGLNNPNNHPAPKAMLNIHFSRNLNSGDVTRTMTAEYGPQWNRKMNKKGKGRAA